MISHNLGEKVCRPARRCAGALLLGVSALAIAVAPQALAQQTTDGVDFTISRYAQEIFDGSQVVSQSKDIVTARAGDGQSTRVIHDVQNGAMTIELGAETLVVDLVSRVTAEGRFTYDQRTGRLSGNDGWAVAAFNALPRKSQTLGRWTENIYVASLMAGGRSSPVALAMSRQAVTVDGVSAELVEFDAPAFNYATADGTPVVHWARGFAVLNAVTGEVYALATQHRATLMEPTTIRPVSIRTTLHGISVDGGWRMKFEAAPPVNAAAARLVETAGDGVHEIDGTKAGPAAAFSAGVAARLDAAAMMLLAPAGSPALLLATADSGAGFAGQVPMAAALSAPVAGDAGAIEGAMRQPDPAVVLAPYGGAAGLALSFADRAPGGIYARPPVGDLVAWADDHQFGLNGPSPEAPEPEQPPNEAAAAAMRFQAEIKQQQELMRIIADLQAQARAAKSKPSQGSQEFPKEILDKLDALLGKNQPPPKEFPKEVLDKLDALLGKNQPPPKEFPKEILDKLDALLGKDKPARGGEFPQEVLDKLDALLGKDKPANRQDFPQEILDKLDSLLGKDRSARLVDLPFGPDAGIEEDYKALLEDLQQEMADALADLKKELLEGDWTDAEDEVINDFFANNAFDYSDMVGVVPTDLSRWSEWLATQNVRELERLASLIGYPNLASALADASSLIRHADDPGYRQWAMQAPSCGGYVGCGPNYLERWWAKQAVVALGDILADSRDIFSTGGFTDIGISGLDLSYLLRDHATQDGDIVRIRISQFGKVIYEGQVNLTNADEIFNLMVGRGVASLEIYAVNEGSLTPNTAQITVDNVVRGQATQTYSLQTGETATLRIEAGAKPAPSTTPSGAPQ